MPKKRMRGICAECQQPYFGFSLKYCSRKCGGTDLKRKAQHSIKMKKWFAENKEEFRAIKKASYPEDRQSSIKNCVFCNAEFHGFADRKYCTVECYYQDPTRRKNYGEKMKGRTAWNKGSGKPTSETNAAKLVEYIKKNGVWNKGIKGSIKPNSGSFTTERVSGTANVNWKGGITSENQRIRQSSEYKQWRKKVFERDRFTCILCGHRSVYNFRRGDKCDIRADHIKPFCLYPELRFDLDNGRTLCLPCDLEHGWNNLRENNDEVNYGKRNKVTE